MKKIRSASFTDIPEHAVCYFAYGDETGMDESDLKEVREWASSHGVVSLTDVSDSRYFSAHPAFGLPGMCVDAVFTVREKEIGRSGSFKSVPAERRMDFSCSDSKDSGRSR